MPFRHQQKNMHNNEKWMHDNQETHSQKWMQDMHNNQNNMQAAPACQ